MSSTFTLDGGYTRTPSIRGSFRIKWPKWPPKGFWAWAFMICASWDLGTFIGAMLTEGPGWLALFSFGCFLVMAALYWWEMR